MIETKTDAEILRAAKELIADQSHFVMGVWAWDRQGREIDPTSSDAWRWNARGAIYAVSGTRPLPFKEVDQDRAPYRLLNEVAWKIAREQHWGFPAGTNVDDNLGHALTLQALEDAAVLAEANESETTHPAPLARDGGGL
jgi:hypothetical protein